VSFSIISPDTTFTDLPAAGDDFDGGSSASSSPEVELATSTRDFHGTLETTKKAERAYRHHLDHSFDDRLSIPLWTPTPVPLGSVGYIDGFGAFISLLDVSALL
jgi:hypothetical protein